jgi:hypothetical protein
MEAAEPGKRRRFAAGDIRGLKYFKPLRALLAGLRNEAAHPNRELLYDQYVSLLLLYFFTPAWKGLRDIQRASDYKTVARKFGVRRASLGSLSEASRVFDPEPLRAIFTDLAQQALAHDALPRPSGVPADLALLAADGTLLDALPKMLWAHWLGEHDKAVKVHLQFDLLRGVPVSAELTDGNGDERVALRERLRAGQLYVVDRGYMDYGLYRDILDAGSSFLARLRGNFVSEAIEDRQLSAEALRAGVQSDQLVWLGAEKSGTRIDRPLRVLKVHVVTVRPHGLKPRSTHVYGKVKSIRLEEPEFDVWLLTDRLDIPAESVALLYRYRWQIEIFFRWFKCTLGCRHLLANSENGIQIQIYVALIASLLVVLWTGRKPNRVALFHLTMYFQGWASLSEVLGYLRKLKTVS